MVAFRRYHPMALRCRRVGAVHHIKSGKAHTEQMLSALPPTPDIACGVHDYLLIYRHTLPALAVAAAPSNSAGLVHRLLPHLLRTINFYLSLFDDRYVSPFTASG